MAIELSVPVPTVDNGGSLYTESRGGDRCLTRFLCVDDARAAKVRDLRLGRLP